MMVQRFMVRVITVNDMVGYNISYLMIMPKLLPTCIGFNLDMTVDHVCEIMKPESH